MQEKMEAQASEVQGRGGWGTQSILNARLSVQSSELGPPSPSGRRWGTQFRRGYKKAGLADAACGGVGGGGAPSYCSG
jgi:hypothetical protein